MSTTPRPTNPKAYFSSFVFSFMENSVMKKILSPFGKFLFTISPGVPIDVRKRFSETPRRDVGITAFLYGLFFCMGFTTFICWTQGTLSGNDPNRLYFINDKWNIILYTLVCPTYIALSSLLIVLTFKHWSALSEFANEMAEADRPKETRRLGFALFVIFLIGAFFITNYMSDILNPNKVKQLYWFMEDVSGGQRTLNRAGYYYVVLNFTLLFITALGVFCFFSLALEVLWVGTSLNNGNINDLKTLREKLDSFTEAYVITKIMAGVYMVNAFVWKFSPLGQTSNLFVAGLILTVVGVFFIAIPRMYVELKWFQYQMLVSPPAEGVEEDHYKDLRPRKVQIWMHVLDTLLIGGFVASFWGVDFNPVKLLENLMKP